MSKESAMEPECILAIDLGTSGPKVALVTVNGEVLASEVESTELFLSEGGGAEQDPDDWWRAIMAATRWRGTWQKRLAAPRR